VAIDLRRRRGVGPRRLGCIADITAAQKPAIIIAQGRSFDEQVATAQTLARAGLAVVIDDWPDLEA
jgi:UDP-N-acetylglucosamine--N-acetylmuramyl-(pentapeptide) pyrophosphoryl-undecaprenol N-acetylglucosamine transferase